MKFELRPFLWRVYNEIAEEDILGNAAQVAFYFTFALFPLLLFLVSLLGILLSDKTDLQNELFQLLAQVMPASAYELVRSTLTEVTSNASGGKLTIGVVITLWSASAGIDNMRSTLNQVYDLKETRSWIIAKLTSLGLTLAIGVITLAGIAFLVYGRNIIGSALGTDSAFVLEPIKWIAVLVLVLLSFALIYNFAPNHDPVQWKWITPGAVIGLGLWLLSSAAFRLYLQYFDSYAATYGSLGAMIILLLWLYITALVILLGGAINAILDEKSGVKKSAEDPEQKRAEDTPDSK